MFDEIFNKSMSHCLIFLDNTCQPMKVRDSISQSSFCLTFVRYDDEVTWSMGMDGYLKIIEFCQRMLRQDFGCCLLKLVLNQVHLVLALTL